MPLDQRIRGRVPRFRPPGEITGKQDRYLHGKRVAGTKRRLPFVSGLTAAFSAGFLKGFRISLEIGKRIAFSDGNHIDKCCV